METGTVQWCDTCGAYSESRTSRRLLNVCPGPPPLSAGKGGMRQQLMALKAGRHPVTGLRLPAPSRNMAALGSGTYARLKPTPNAGNEGHFVLYEPRVVVVPVPSGVSAERKRWLMRGRLRCKIAKSAALLRRRRRKDAKSEVREVIRSFIGEADGARDQEALSSDLDERATAEDEECEAFWASLPVEVSRERHILNIPSLPTHDFLGKAVKSRNEQPGVQRRAELSRRCTVLTCFHFGCNGGHS